MTITQPPLRIFWGYFGAKWRMAKLYPEPNRDTIVEPFAGAAGYSLRYYDRKVILCDAYEPIAGIWDYLIRTPAEEIRRLPLIREGMTVDDVKAPQEAKWLMGWWLQPANQTPGKKASTWVTNGTFPGWSEKARERVASQVDRIRHWKIIHGSYLDLPDIEATWFVDPPYNNKAGRTYRMHDIDYEQLGQWCRERTGQTIVCEQEGSDWLPFEFLADVHCAPHKGKAKKRSKEVVYLQETENR